MIYVIFPKYLQNIWHERLSRDDEQAGESNSIQNQKKYLEEYARQKGLRNIRHFYDDGYSGTNFNRPGFAALLEEIEAGHVEVLIVKDLSSFGRNYLQVGYYTEILFPKKGVRFIAVNNIEGTEARNSYELWIYPKKALGKKVAYFGDSITDPNIKASKVKYWGFLQDWLGILKFLTD